MKLENDHVGQRRSRFKSDRAIASNQTIESIKIIRRFNDEATKNGMDAELVNLTDLVWKYSEKHKIVVTPEFNSLKYFQKSDTYADEIGELMGEIYKDNYVDLISESHVDITTFTEQHRITQKMYLDAINLALIEAEQVLIVQFPGQWFRPTLGIVPIATILNCLYAEMNDHLIAPVLQAKSLAYKLFIKSLEVYHSAFKIYADFVVDSLKLERAAIELGIAKDELAKKLNKGNKKDKDPTPHIPHSWILSKHGDFSIPEVVGPDKKWQLSELHNSVTCQYEGTIYQGTFAMLIFDHSCKTLTIDTRIDQHDEIIELHSQINKKRFNLIRDVEFRKNKIIINNRIVHPLINFQLVIEKVEVHAWEYDCRSSRDETLVTLKNLAASPLTADRVLAQYNYELVLQGWLKDFKMDGKVSAPTDAFQFKNESITLDTATKPSIKIKASLGNLWHYNTIFIASDDCEDTYEFATLVDELKEEPADTYVKASLTPNSMSKAATFLLGSDEDHLRLSELIERISTCYVPGDEQIINKMRPTLDLAMYVQLGIITRDEAKFIHSNGIIL